MEVSTISFFFFRLIFFGSIFFLSQLVQLSQGLWGAGSISDASDQDIWYQVEKNQSIVLTGIMNEGGSFEVTAVRHTRKKTTITYLVKEKKHQLDISPNLKSYPVKNATMIQMKRSFRMDGLSQHVTLFSNGVDYLIIGDNIKSRQLKGGHPIYFHRPNLNSLHYRVMIIHDEQIHLAQPKESLTLTMDGAKWDLILYQFRVFEILKLQRLLELQKKKGSPGNRDQSKWVDESPVFDYDYLLIRKK